MSSIDRGSNAGGGWKVGSDSTLKYSGKFSGSKLRRSPGTDIEVRSNGHKVTGPNFLAQILKDIAADPAKSAKLLNLKDNESVEIILGKNEVKYVFAKATKQAAVAERVEGVSTQAINQPKLTPTKPILGPPPPINRQTKPKPPQEPLKTRADPKNKPSPPLTKQQQKAEADKEADIWRRLNQDGVVELD